MKQHHLSLRLVPVIAGIATCMTLSLCAKSANAQWLYAGAILQPDAAQEDNYSVSNQSGNGEVTGFAESSDAAGVTASVGATATGGNTPTEGNPDGFSSIMAGLLFHTYEYVIYSYNQDSVNPDPPDYVNVADVDIAMATSAYAVYNNTYSDYDVWGQASAVAFGMGAVISSQSNSDPNNIVDEVGDSSSTVQLTLDDDGYTAYVPVEFGIEITANPAAKWEATGYADSSAAATSAISTGTPYYDEDYDW